MALESENGVNKLWDSLGSSDRLKSAGIEGPNISVSRIPDRRPCRAKARERFAELEPVSELCVSLPDQDMCGEVLPATVLLPTPPFAEDTAITLETFFIGRRSGSPRCIRGIDPVLGRPCM